MEDFVIAPGQDDKFVPLSRTSSGRLFRKHILTKGKLHYPGAVGGTIDINDEFLDTMVANFNNKVCDIVQVPVADSKNSHTEDPLRNIGEVVKLQREGDKLYSYIDVRKHQEEVGQTLLGASAMLALNYTDTRTGTKAGPTLLHVAVTNRPHVLNLEDFELIAASADGNNRAVLLTAETSTKEKAPMDLDDLVTILKDEHDIDLPALQRSAAGAASALELSGKLEAALNTAGILELSNGESASADDLIGAVAQLAETSIELSARLDEVVLEGKKAKAEAEVDSLVAKGFITPAKRDANVKLLLSNEETFRELLPEQPIIKLSSEVGTEPADTQQDSVITAEVTRYAELANKS